MCQVGKHNGRKRLSKMRIERAAQRNGDAKKGTQQGGGGGWKKRTKAKWIVSEGLTN